MLPVGFVAIAAAPWKPFSQIRSTPKVTPFKWRRFTVPTKRDSALPNCQLFSLSGAREPPRCPGKLFLNRSLPRGAYAFQPPRAHLRVSNTMATLVPTLIVRVKQRLNLTPARQRLLLDAAIIVSLFLLALALRLPYLHDVPRYTDEVNEVRVGLSIARGEALRLTNADTYMGALYNYLLAGLFLLFGEHPHVPRLLIAFSGAATVPLVYILGKAINGRATGFMAALLLTGNAEHIFNSGHVAYSHSLTPAFTSLALFFLWRALNGGSYWMLLVGAFTFGLAVQTHPTAV